MITSKTDFQNFINGLNFGHHPDVMRKDALKMHLSLDARVMSPSKAEEVIVSLGKDKVIKIKDGYVDLRYLYDPVEKRYILRSGTTGKTLKSKSGNTGARTVKYIAPGHTQVNYAHRVLDIHFKETPKEFQAKARLRRVHAAKKAAKTRAKGMDALYVDVDQNGNMITVTKTGKSADLRAKSRADKGRNAIIKKRIAKDAYSIEDMRALLRDDHWEEVSGNKRWNYDNKATVKEFNKYLKSRR